MTIINLKQEQLKDNTKYEKIICDNSFIEQAYDDKLKFIKKLSQHLATNAIIELPVVINPKEAIIKNVIQGIKFHCDIVGNYNKETILQFMKYICNDKTITEEPAIEIYQYVAKNYIENDKIEELLISKNDDKCYYITELEEIFFQPNFLKVTGSNKVKNTKDIKIIQDAHIDNIIRFDTVILSYFK